MMILFFLTVFLNASSVQIVPHTPEGKFTDHVLKCLEKQGGFRSIPTPKATNDTSATASSGKRKRDVTDIEESPDHCRKKLKHEDERSKYIRPITLEKFPWETATWERALNSKSSLAPLKLDLPKLEYDNWRCSRFSFLLPKIFAGSHIVKQFRKDSTTKSTTPEHEYKRMLREAFDWKIPEEMPNEDMCMCLASYYANIFTEDDERVLQSGQELANTSISKTRFAMWEKILLDFQDINSRVSSVQTAIENTENMLSDQNFLLEFGLPNTISFEQASNQIADDSKKANLPYPEALIAMAKGYNMYVLEKMRSKSSWGSNKEFIDEVHLLRQQIKNDPETHVKHNRILGDFYMHIYTIQKERGGPYKRINEALTKDRFPWTPEAYVVRKGFRVMYNMQQEQPQTRKRGQVTQNDKGTFEIVWRGMNSLEDGHFMDFCALWDEEFYWPSYVSTSRDKAQALKFTKVDPDDAQSPTNPQSALFKIVLPFHAYAVDTSSVSAYPEEEEVLLYHNSVFRVKHVELSRSEFSGRGVVTLEYVNNPFKN